MGTTSPRPDVLEVAGGRAEPRPPDVAVLDIGSGTGALLIHASADLLGTEIELSPLGHDDERVHVEVWDRAVNGAVHHAALFPPMRAGTYTVWLPKARGVRCVDVEDGRVTEICL